MSEPEMASASVGRILDTLHEIGVIDGGWAYISTESCLSDFSLTEDELRSFEAKLGLPKLDENITICNIAVMLEKSN